MDPPHINYIDHNSVLVINPAGKIRQLFVPFRVQVIYETSKLKLNCWVMVEEIQAHERHKLIYRVGDDWWQYDLFRIAIVF